MFASLGNTSNVAAFASSTAPFIAPTQAISNTSPSKRRLSAPELDYSSSLGSESGASPPDIRTRSFHDTFLSEVDSNVMEYELQDLWNFYNCPTGFLTYLKMYSNVLPIYFTPILSCIELWVKTSALKRYDGFKQIFCTSSINEVEDTSVQVFQFKDSHPPYLRKPLWNRIKEFKRDFPEILTLKNTDLDTEKSFFTVLWLPLLNHRLLESVLSGTVLTFHNFEFENKKLVHWTKPVLQVPHVRLLESLPTMLLAQIAGNDIRPRTLKEEVHLDTEELFDPNYDTLSEPDSNTRRSDIISNPLQKNNNRNDTPQLPIAFSTIKRPFIPNTVNKFRSLLPPQRALQVNRLKCNGVFIVNASKDFWSATDDEFADLLSFESDAIAFVRKLAVEIPDFTYALEKAKSFS
ncbi:hypothetical protein PCE1_001907 [Barthelona sp. PCE]